MTLGEKIQFLRKGKGISQEAFAEAMSVSRQAVSKWETGLSYPDTENLIKISAFFAISADELIETKHGNINGDENTQDDGQDESPDPPLSGAKNEKAENGKGADSSNAAHAAAPEFAQPKKSHTLRNVVIAFILLFIVLPITIFTVSFQDKEPNDYEYSDMIEANEIVVPYSTKEVYTAFTALQGGNLTEAEIAKNRSIVYAGLEGLDWQEYGRFGEAEAKILETQQALLDYLAAQTALTQTEISAIQRGSLSNLDGWLSEDYCNILARAMELYPKEFIHALTENGHIRLSGNFAVYGESLSNLVCGLTVYGAAVTDTRLIADQTLINDYLTGDSLTEEETQWAQTLYTALLSPYELTGENT